LVKVDQVVKVRIDNIEKDKLRLSMMEKFDVRAPPAHGGMRCHALTRDVPRSSVP
jgi:hypothetical protein